MSEDCTVPGSRLHVEALPVDMDSVTEKLELKAKTELFEDDETRILSLELLRSMLKNEKNLRWQDDDLFLLGFLRAKKFHVRKAFSLIQGFYNNLGKHRDIYYNFNFDYMKRLMEQNLLTILPYRDSEGCAIIMFRCEKWNPELSSSVEQLFCAHLAFIEALRYPPTQIAGFQLIVDFKNYSRNQAMHTTPACIGFFTDMVMRALPLRMKGFHVVNQNHLVSFIWALVRIFFSQKLRERIHMHGRDMKSLHQFFHPSILPADLEGDLPPFDNSDWRARMEASEDYIKHVFSFGYENYLQKIQKERSGESSDGNR